MTKHGKSEWRDGRKWKSMRGEVVKSDGPDDDSSSVGRQDGRK